MLAPTQRSLLSDRHVARHAATGLSAATGAAASGGLAGAGCWKRTGRTALQTTVPPTFTGMVEEEVDDVTLGRLLGAAFANLDAWLIEHRRTNSCLPGSRHAFDDHASHPFLVSAAAHHALTHALDHFRTLRAVMVKASELPLAAGFTLLRGTVENAATAVWLLQPADQPTRVLRRLQLAQTDLADTAKLEALGFKRTGPTGPEYRDKIRAIGAAAGVDMIRLDGAPPGQARMVREAAAATSRAPEQVEATWRLCSGFSHGRSWSTATALAREDVAEVAPGVWDVEMRAPLGAVTAVTQTAVDVLDAALRLHVTYRVRPPASADV